MLERIREGSQSFAAKAVLVLIILTFALAGVGSYVTGGAETVSYTHLTLPTTPYV